MRILPLFILPHTADGACTNDEALPSAYNTDADNDDAFGIFLVEGSDADVGCEVEDADSYPASWDLKMTAATPPLWDFAHAENYESPNHGAYQVDNASATAVTTPSTTKKHWHLHGEQLQDDSSIIDICYCGKRGATTVRGRSNWKKSSVTDISVTENKGDTVYVETPTSAATSNVAAGKICLCNENGTLNASAMADVDEVAKILNHGEVGDAATGTKTCHNLLVEFTTENKPLAAKCTDAQICDQFGGTKVCVDKTEQLFNTKTAYTKADATKKYCIRRVKGGPDDTSFGTYAATDQRAYRPTTADDLSNPACTADYYCNPYGSAADRCLDKEKVLGDDTVASAVRAEGTTTEKCLGVGTAGSADCTITQHCNPHADTNANLCIDAAKAFKHAEAGNSAADTPKDTCIADNAVQANCADTEVCNYGAAAPNDVCLAKAELVGKPDIVKGADNWGVIKLKSLRVQPALAGELCMARAFDAGTFSLKTAGAKSFSKQCAIATDETAEICNPNATSLADVCVTKNTVVVNHGDQVDTTKVACIGDTHYKLVLAADMICNMNGNSVANLEIALADTLAGKLDANNNVIKEGFNKPGELVSGSDTTFKWCFDKTQAAQCTDKQTCNTAGTYDDADKWLVGSDAKATCVDTEALIEHGGKGDDTKMYCLGVDGASKYTKDEAAETPVDQCSRADGTLYKAEEQLAAGAMVEADTPTAVRCFAEASSLFYDASCLENYVCNPTGSDSAENCGDAENACTLSNICVHKDARLAVGEKFDESNATINICLGDTPAECTKDNPYCQTTGECAKTAVSGGGADGEGEGDTASGSSTASLVGLSVAAILSA